MFSHVNAPPAAIFVLLTDDQTMFRMIAKRHLTTHFGMQVQFVEACDADQAIAACKAQIEVNGKNFDLIIMDFNMPPLQETNVIARNGQEAVLHIRALEAEKEMDADKCSKIITWSSDYHEKMAGTDAVLPKPFKGDQLNETVSTLMQARPSAGSRTSPP